MKKCNVRLSIMQLLVLSVFLFSGSVLRAEYVEITSPSNGDGVKDSVLIEGKAELSPGHHLWVLAGIDGTKDWWPQGGGEVEITADTWKVLSRIGKKGGDWEMQFRVAAIAVDERAHNDLQKWVTSSAALGRWDPITMPNTSEECEVKIVTLTKQR